MAVRLGSNWRRRNRPRFIRENFTGRQKRSQSPTNKTTTKFPTPLLPIIAALAALFGGRRERFRFQVELAAEVAEHFCRAKPPSQCFGRYWLPDRPALPARGVAPNLP